MISPYRNILRVVALITSCCVAHIYVFAGTTVPASAFTPQTGGTINTTNNQPVVVNGNNVKPGTTVLSGSTIETPAGVGATVQLGFAEVSISPGSEIILDFTPGTNVTVTLRHGCAVIRTVGNAQGRIIRPDGSSVPTGEKKVADACDHEGAPAANPGAGTAGGVGGGINKTALALLLVGAAAAAVTALTLVGRGINPSPSTP
jgi:hypothetical protein